LKDKRTYTRYDFFFLTLYTLLCGSIFSYILYHQIPSDIGAHTQILLRFLERDSFPTPPLYYTLLYLLHFIMPYKEGFGLAALLILTGAGFLKYFWSLSYLKRYCPQVDSKYVNIFVFALMFFAPIILFWNDGQYWYLGKFTSVIWHNSTTLLSLPFSILLFYYSLIFFEDGNKRLLGAIYVICVVIILIKPSFIFSFLPAFIIILFFLEQQFSKTFNICLVGALSLIILIMIEKEIIYSDGLLDHIYAGGSTSEIKIKPFFVWLSWSEHPVKDIVVSFLFAIFFVLFYFKVLIKDLHFVYSTLMLLIGLMIFFSLVETGHRILDGNFYWQVIISLSIWHLVLVKNFLLLSRATFSYGSNAVLNCKNWFLIILFVLHVVSGFTYLARIVISEQFL